MRLNGQESNEVWDSETEILATAAIRGIKGVRAALKAQRRGEHLHSAEVFFRGFLVNLVSPEYKLDPVEDFQQFYKHLDEVAPRAVHGLDAEVLDFFDRVDLRVIFGDL